MNLLIKNDYSEIKEGLINIVPFERSNLEYIGFDILRLKKGNSFSLTKKGFETAIVIFYGKCSIFLNEIAYENINFRENFFKENASCVYVPNNEKFVIKAIEDIEVGLCYAKTNKNKKSFIVRPEDVRERKVGENSYKRVVKDIIYGIHDVDRFIIGETISKDGAWSSFPPHKHDRDLLPVESKFEEIYHFRMEPAQGFAIQKVYTEEKDIDETYTVKNYDTIIIPKGYHPVVGCPGYNICYFWILGGEKREYKLFEDGEHSWITK